jgi:hypothetical protein
MGWHAGSRAVVALLVAMGVACSCGTARGGVSESTTTRSLAPDSKTASRSASASRVPTACPTAAPLTVPHHQRDGTTRTLVPGQPIALFACRYHGFNQPQPIGTLAHASELPAAFVAHELNATRRPPPGAVYHCPAEFGETYMLYFSYRGGRPLLVRFNHGGCLYVTNGDLTLPFPPPQLTQRLEAALGQDHL